METKTQTIYDYIETLRDQKVTLEDLPGHLSEAFNLPRQKAMAYVLAFIETHKDE